MKIQTAIFGVAAILLCCTGSPAHAAPDIEVELAKQQLVQAIKAENWTDMLARAKALRARKVDLGTEILFFEGRGLKELGRPGEAEAKLTEYVNRSGGKGANYGTALEYISALRGDRKARERAQRTAKMHAETLRNWEKLGRIGQITELNSEWGFIRIRIDTPERLKLPLQLKIGETALSLGKLRKVAENEYTVAAPVGLKDLGPGVPVYTCCRPQ